MIPILLINQSTHKPINDIHKDEEMNTNKSIRQQLISIILLSTLSSFANARYGYHGGGGIGGWQGSGGGNGGGQGMGMGHTSSSAAMDGGSGSGRESRVEEK